MKIIISPAKIMKEETLGVDAKSTPFFLNNALEIYDCMKSLPNSQLEAAWDCNSTLIQLNKSRLQRYNLKDNLMPAIFIYDGLQYKKMAANVFSSLALEYVNNHLFILSGLYGALRPLDGINPYRLMMGAKISIKGHNSLYSYWGDKIYQFISKDDHDILNLASKEYYDAIQPYLKDKDHVITCVFLSNNKGKLVMKATEAKACRGLMVRYLAENNINDFEGVKAFNEMNYFFDKGMSSEDEFVFIKKD